jgi:hypothetical protein
VLRYLVLAFGLLPSAVFAWFATNVSVSSVRSIVRVRTLMMGRTLDPETLVVNKAKMTLGNNPKVKTK